ncbi:MAG: hypothetical protein FD138_3505 [Planctomycetota bacterium]|nr:MAG: hypothetical protein FD138_3505 [Planctomycetota bacterium]
MTVAAIITRQLPMTDQPRINRIGRDRKSRNQSDGEQDLALISPKMGRK